MLLPMRYASVYVTVPSVNALTISWIFGDSPWRTPAGAIESIVLEIGRPCGAVLG